MSADRNGAHLLVAHLEAQGVEYVFGIPGAKVDPVFDALVGSKIKTVVCRHEQNATFIAGGLGRLTGKAGVVLVTSGPGCSNLATGLATANTEGDPVVALGGAVPSAERLKQTHQSMDAVAMLRPVTKYAAEIDAVDASLGDHGQRLPRRRIGPAGRGFRRPAQGHHEGARAGRDPGTVQAAAARRRRFGRDGRRRPNDRCSGAPRGAARHAGKPARGDGGGARPARQGAVRRRGHLSGGGRGAARTARLLRRACRPVPQPAGRPPARCRRPGGHDRLRPGRIRPGVVEPRPRTHADPHRLRASRHQWRLSAGRRAAGGHRRHAAGARRRDQGPAESRGRPTCWPRSGAPTRDSAPKRAGMPARQSIRCSSSTPCRACSTRARPSAATSARSISG